MQREVIIDGGRMYRQEHFRYRGPGMVSANNSSRLLMDYKAEHPEKYREILEYIFGKDAAGITHLKLEMGSDINSSSGTEPAVKRYSDEDADVSRGAGFMLAADAKKINPELTLDMLFWSEPRWVSDAGDVYAARYRWYRETLDAAYKTYGLVFDYVSVVRNERAYDAEWIKYFAKRLKAEKDGPYDYSAIKIVAGEEVCTWNIAGQMLCDSELMDAIDVVGSHYTSFADENAKKLALEYGKELWFSEASSPMAYSKGISRFEEGKGLGGINGVLDVATRFISMFACGYMTLCEYQPVVSAYYDGVCYCHKSFIDACDPWSGYYSLESGFYMNLHFSRFFKKGWRFIEGANFGDGKAGGDGHAIVDAVYSYMTAADGVSGDYSVAVANTTDKPLEYCFKVKKLKKADSPVFLWESKGSDGPCYDEYYFKKKAAIKPVYKDGYHEYSITVAPYSLVTLSTLNAEEKEYAAPDENERKALPLPYYDDFRYEEYPKEYLPGRGFAPRFMTDQGGAFEVVREDGGNVLMQKILPESKAEEWGATPEPTTNFGDDRWFNYSVSADIRLDENSGSDNYAGVGLRYILAADGESGYAFRLYGDGSWQLRRNGTEIAKGRYENYDAKQYTRLKLSAVNDMLAAWINGEMQFERQEEGGYICCAGRAALYSAYANNRFARMLAEPA